MITATNNSPSIFSYLSDMQTRSYPLYQLVDKIDLGIFETDFQPIYYQDNDHPSKLICLICSLLILIPLSPYSYIRSLK